MVIVSGHRALAEAYLVHVLDVYEHYRFRAIQTDMESVGKSSFSGFLDTTDGWQDGLPHWLALRARQVPRAGLTMGASRGP